MNRDDVQLIRDDMRKIFDRLDSIFDRLDGIDGRLDKLEKGQKKAIDLVVGLARTTNKRFDKIENALRDHNIEIPA